MADLLGQYYRGIAQRLRSEVDFINSLFRHPGLKGEGNEAILRNLLSQFIPKRFQIGTGVIVDRRGNQSRQCDIVIYDGFMYPSLFALTSVHLFPVDVVYAVIEVKTTLSADKAKEARENIASVRALEVIPSEFMLPESKEDGGYALVSYKPCPPVGCVFAYDSDVQKAETFKAWFTPSASDAPTYPSLVACLDQGLTKFQDISPPVGAMPDTFSCPLVDDSGHAVEPSASAPTYEHRGSLYPVKELKGRPTAIDQSAVLLLFIVLLTEMLTYKKINPTIRFSKHYLTTPLRNIIEV